MGLIEHKETNLELWCDPPSAFWDLWETFKDHGQVNTVVDIGAHYGSFSLMAAAKGAKSVIAFEPFSYGVLKRNISRNGYQKTIRVISKAITYFGESVNLYGGGNQGQASSFAKNKSNWLGTFFSFPFPAVFDLIDGEIDYLKIDVEGAEHEFFLPSDPVRFGMKKVKFLDLEIHYCSPGSPYKIEECPLREYAKIMGFAPEFGNMIIRNNDGLVDRPKNENSHLDD